MYLLFSPQVGNYDNEFMFKWVKAPVKLILCYRAYRVLHSYVYRPSITNIYTSTVLKCLNSLPKVQLFLNKP